MQNSISAPRLDTARLVDDACQNSSITHCNTLQHTATHCNTLQHAATRCSTLQHSDDCGDGGSSATGSVGGGGPGGGEGGGVAGEGVLDSVHDLLTLPPKVKTKDDLERAEDLLIPPLNFGRVCRGVYRSGFPGKKNFTFLKVGCVSEGFVRR